MTTHTDKSTIGFVVGASTTFVIVLLVVVVLGYRAGYRSLWHLVVPPAPAVLALPPGIVDELAKLNGVIDNAYNPTGQPLHDTILVQPHPILRSVLRPDVRIEGFMLRTTAPLNLDPPVLYLPAGAPQSHGLRDFLERQTRIRYAYSVDAQGFRMTEPAVQAPRKILFVGDSVLFGIGVDDAHTIASQVQQLAHRSAQIVNAGVGNYNADHAFEVARRLSTTGEYDTLVYVACQNDFEGGDAPTSHLDRATAVLERFAGLKPAFPRGVVVLLTTYLEYAAHDVLLDAEWSQRRIAQTDALRQGLPRVAQALGLTYLDWVDTVAQHRERERSIFSPFALYVDHAHLSPLGAKLAAAQIYETIR